MSRIARYIVDAIVLAKQSPTDLARENKIARRTIYNWLTKFKKGGYASLEPKSRRPKSCSHQVPTKVIKLIVKLRRQLLAAGYDAGPDTIQHHLAKKVEHVPSVSTIWRILKRQGLVTPQPHKRPKSSLIRFQATLPNETWQADCSQWLLADGTVVDILNFIDDHSRVALASQCFRLAVRAHDVVNVFKIACDRFGLPASVLTDNGAVFTARPRGGKVIFESELERLSIDFKHSSPNHPQTCGKVERFHQTLKQFLKNQPPAKTLAELQRQLDTFRDYYNMVRPHRALDRRTPLSVFKSATKATPVAKPMPLDHRVRLDKIDSCGKVTLRYLGRLQHIAVGIRHRNRKVRLLVHGPDVRIITDQGELLRALTIDEKRTYQPLGGRWPVQNVA